MKIAFITIHVGSNFGSTLQTIATSEVLKQLGGEPICVNYIPPRVTYKRYWNVAKGSALRFLRRIIFFPFLYEETNRFSSYLSKYCKVSNKIYADSDFVKKCPKADVYITGSDQVWNTTHNEGLDTHYFFDGIKGKKIAYASSIGKSSVDEQELKWLSQYTKDYHSIYVREESAVDIFKQIGRDVRQVVDPTLMLNRDQWSKYASERWVKEPYLFVYLPYNIKNKQICYDTARKIARKKKLKVITYSHSFYKEPLADHTYLFIGPGDVLSLIYHADYVVTNSFHGLAFSINLNRQFCLYMPSNFSTRISSLANLCGLNERIIDGVISDDLLDKEIDFSSVNDIIQLERVKAITYLSHSLSNK